MANGNGNGSNGFNQIGRNIRTKMEGNELVIRIDTTQNFGASASGKTQIVASTQGNVAIPCGEKILHLGVNAYTK